jgi:hypothetical protein
MIPNNIAIKPMFIALCECLRWWHAFDAAQCYLIETHGMDGIDVRRIAIQYGFIRNLKTGGDCDLVERLRSVADLSAQNLQQRAEQLAEVIQQYQATHDAHHRAFSGATKLFWFLNPEGWTPYDKLASAGLGIKGTSSSRMINFYKSLDELAFLQKADEISQILREHELDYLRGERVYDKILMMRGAPNANMQTVALAYANALPSHYQEQLINVGQELTDETDGGLGLDNLQ